MTMLRHHGNQIGDKEVVKLCCPVRDSFNTAQDSFNTEHYPSIRTPCVSKSLE